MSKDTAETWRPEQRTRSDLCCTRILLTARWRGVKGRGERPAARERPGRNKVGEDRVGPKQGCGGKKGAGWETSRNPRGQAVELDGAG